MSSPLTSAEDTDLEGEMIALLVDTVAVQTVNSTGTATGTTKTYTTDSGRDAVPCLFARPRAVERIANGVTVTETEYPVWFTAATVPARTKALLAVDGSRYQVTGVNPDTAWSDLVEVRAARIGG
jgi:hypothetical protein